MLNFKDENYCVMILDAATDKALPDKYRQYIDQGCTSLDYNTFDFNFVIKLIPKNEQLYVLNYGTYRKLIITTYLNLSEVELSSLTTEIKENLEFSLYGECDYVKLPE